MSNNIPILRSLLQLAHLKHFVWKVSLLQLILGGLLIGELHLAHIGFEAVSVLHVPWSLVLVTSLAHQYRRKLDITENMMHAMMVTRLPHGITSLCRGAKPMWSNFKGPLSVSLRVSLNAVSLKKRPYTRGFMLITSWKERRFNIEVIADRLRAYAMHVKLQILEAVARS